MAKMKSSPNIHKVAQYIQKHNGISKNDLANVLGYKHNTSKIWNLIRELEKRNLVKLVKQKNKWYIYPINNQPSSTPSKPTETEAVLYGRRLLSYYTQLCEEDISERNLYNLIAEVEILINTDAHVFTEISRSDISKVKKLMSSNNLSKNITGVHYFFQLIHDTCSNYGLYVVVHKYNIKTSGENYRATSLDELEEHDHEYNTLSYLAEKTLDKLQETKGFQKADLERDYLKTRSGDRDIFWSKQFKGKLPDI